MAAQQIPGKLIGIVVLLLLVGAVLFKCVQTIPPGHIGVATLFGKVQDQTYAEGLHIVNPLYRFVLYDTRQKTHKETAAVPSQDQLQTKVDVSVQYRVIASAAPDILRNTGEIAQLIDVHLVPKLRSVLREQGKTIEKAEEFFLEATQQQLQTAMTSSLQDYLQPLGLEIQAVLIRDINLPPFIVKAIEAKKEREQEVEKQKAELERFKTEQQQKIAQAEAERQAAEEEAQRRRVIADAQAYEIEKINEAVANSPAYIQLQALEALKSISKDPSTKIYFMDGSSPSPLPLMHMGEGATGPAVGR